MDQPTPSRTVSLPGRHTVELKGRAGFDRLRDSTQDVCSLSLDSNVSSFDASTTLVNLGSAVLLEVEMSSLLLERSPLHLARGSVNHVQLQFQLAGSTCWGQRRLLPGEIGLFDMQRASRSAVIPPPGASRARQLVVMLPRAELSAVLPDLDYLHACAMHAGSAYGAVLRNHTLSLMRHGDALAPNELAAAKGGLLTLISAAFTGIRRSEREAPLLDRPRIEAIKRHIRGHAASPQLTPAALCRAFGISRAVLYRWFEPDGGIARFVQRVRLERALRLLVAPERRHLRILDVAVECGFSSDASFVRAFHRHFGFTPGDARSASVRPAEPRASEQVYDTLLAKRVFAQVG